MSWDPSSARESPVIPLLVAAENHRLRSCSGCLSHGAAGSTDAGPSVTRAGSAAAELTAGDDAEEKENGSDRGEGRRWGMEKTAALQVGASSPIVRPCLDK